MEWIEIDGAGFRYELAGSDDDTLVLAQKMGGTLESRAFVLPRLRGRRAVLRFDMRGAGQSAKLRGTAPFDAMADDVAARPDACLAATGG